MHNDVSSVSAVQTYISDTRKHAMKMRPKVPVKNYDAYFWMKYCSIYCK